MEVSILKEEEATKDKKIKIVEKNDMEETNEMEEKFIICKNFKSIKSISYTNYISNKFNN